MVTAQTGRLLVGLSTFAADFPSTIAVTVLAKPYKLKIKHSSNVHNSVKRLDRGSPILDKV